MMMTYCTFDSLVIIGFNLSNKCFLIQATLIRRSIVLSLPPQLVFPAWCVSEEEKGICTWLMALEWADRSIAFINGLQVDL
jgi:hypothetical protein